MQGNYRRLSELQQLYYWHILTARLPKSEEESVGQAIIQARVDLNPHQVDAALFAFRNPLDGGVLLADEVGLGKTIETGLIISQLWAEGKRNILIISPKSLRHQWRDELKTLFYLDSEIVDTPRLRQMGGDDAANPFLTANKILITNEHFVEKHDSLISSKKWDLVVIDEAHRLRNVWRTGKNEAKRAKRIRDSIKNYKKLLLTATPMQNNLMELYGLVSFLDPHILGTSESFQRTFVNMPSEARGERLVELRNRMKVFFKRELRKNVREYISYTNRYAKLFTYSPTEDEEKLRKDFEEYLRKEQLIGIPAQASHLTKLVYFKLLASSTFAIKNSLLNLYARLVLASVGSNDRTLYDKLMQRIAEALTMPGGEKAHEMARFEKVLFNRVNPKTFEGLLADRRKTLIAELAESESELTTAFEVDLEEEIDSPLSRMAFSKSELINEANAVLSFIVLSRQITKNTKGKALTEALDKQFITAREQGWPEKVVIFTEFRSTQDYVLTVLEQYGLERDKDVVVFNGSSGDAESRAKLVQEFKNSKKIFLTTEAGAEGLNLQFCNLLINYDLPWNPQRIEQRIGRCHRYGQKLDVVVINFLNKKNIADNRVLELLSEKFSLFEGAFGASDEVLGQIESGVDIEKKIFELYLKCRKPDEIQAEFDQLMAANRERVDRRMEDAERRLLESFDEEVQRKLKMRKDRVTSIIDTRQALVRDVFLSSLPETAFHYDGVVLRSMPAFKGTLDESLFTFQRNEDRADLIHSGHPLFTTLKAKTPSNFLVTFQYSGRHNIAVLKDLVGKLGYFSIFKLTVVGLEARDFVVPIVLLDESPHPLKAMTQETGDKLLSVTSIVEPCGPILEDGVLTAIQGEIDHLLKMRSAELVTANTNLYQEEVQKIESYFEDLREQRRYEILDAEKKLGELKKARMKASFEEQRRINAEVQKLKDTIEKLDEDIAELRKSGRAAEKQRMAELEKRVVLKTSTELLASGRFKVE